MCFVQPPLLTTGLLWERGFAVQEIVLIVVALAIPVALLAVYLSLRRRIHMTFWATSRGLRFTASRVDDLDDRLGFRCLKQGYLRNARNVVEGSWKGRDFVGFDYHYATRETGQALAYHRYFSAAAMRCGFPVKPLVIRPKELHETLSGLPALGTVRFELVAFNRSFRVTAADGRWAYDVLHQRAMDFLLGAPRFVIEFGGFWILATRFDDFDVNDFQDAADLLQGILDRMPDYLGSQQRDTVPS